MFSKQEHSEKVLSSWNPIKEKLYWVIVKITNDRDLAEDTLQEALITAIEKYQTLKDESKFEPWFLTIAIRKAYELLSARKVYVSATDIDDSSLPDWEDASGADSSDALQYKDMVSVILANLKPEMKRYLFYLKYIEDRPMEEIIGITGIKEGTLKSIYHRMRKDLGALLAKEYDLHVPR